MKSCYGCKWLYPELQTVGGETYFCGRNNMYVGAIDVPNIEDHEPLQINEFCWEIMDEVIEGS